MFEDLFVDPRTIANLWSAPLLEERLRYLRHCAQSGARPSTLRRIAAAQTSLVRLLDLREAERVSMPRIEAVARHWAQRGGCRLLDHCVRPEDTSVLRRPRATMAALRRSTRRALQGAARPRRRGCGVRGVDA